MTDRIALFLGGIVAALIALDLFMGWGGTLFVLRKLYDLMNLIIFWR